MTGNSIMTETRAKELREYAWKYFDLHANQRMSVFNFFLILAGLLAASYVNSLTAEVPNYGVCAIVANMLLCVAFIFWRLDQRTAFLIKNAEKALMEAEKAISSEVREPGVDQLFRYEDGRTKELTKHWWSNHLTYGACLRGVFFGFGLAGVLGGVAALWLLICKR